MYLDPQNWIHLFLNINFYLFIWMHQVLVEVHAGPTIFVVACGIF